jgi:hypothetical protein
MLSAKGDHNAQRGEHVDGLGVEVVLVDHARPGGDGAESRREHRGPDGASRPQPGRRQPRDRDRGQRHRIVDEDQQAAGAVPEPFVADVVEVVGGEPPVGDEDGEPDGCEEGPNGPDRREPPAPAHPTIIPRRRTPD